MTLAQIGKPSGDQGIAGGPQSKAARPMTKKKHSDADERVKRENEKEGFSVEWLTSAAEDAPASPSAIPGLEVALERALDEAARAQGKSLLRKPSEFEEACRLVVGVVYRALAGTGDPRHVHWLAHAFENRKRYEWLRICEECRSGASADGKGPAMLPLLPKLLAEVDPAAERLTVEQIQEALRATGSPTGFAARLTVACGALGYSGTAKAPKKAREDAKRAFAHCWKQLRQDGPDA